MKIHVTIDRLILEGVTIPHGERQALREAVARLRGGTVEWSAGGGAVPLGQQIAQAVVPSLGAGEGLGGSASPGRTP